MLPRSPEHVGQDPGSARPPTGFVPTIATSSMRIAIVFLQHRTECSRSLTGHAVAPIRRSDRPPRSHPPRAYRIPVVGTSSNPDRTPSSPVRRSGPRLSSFCRDPPDPADRHVGRRNSQNPRRRLGTVFCRLWLGPGCRGRRWMTVDPWCDMPGRVPVPGRTWMRARLWRSAATRTASRRLIPTAQMLRLYHLLRKRIAMFRDVGHEPARILFPSLHDQ